jgi:hypothetical protein
MRYEVITSCNADLWSRYAERSIPGWQHQPRIYWESDQDWQDPRWDRLRAQTQHAETPRLSHQYRRFTWKVQAQIHAIRNSSADYVIWLDADVVQTQLFTPESWQAVMPAADHVATFLNRQPVMYAETGWIAYNCTHAGTRPFVNALEEIYLSQRIFDIKQWHDAFVWDHVRQQTQTPMRNILSRARTDDPFAHSDLADYFCHHKGPRKQHIAKTLQQNVIL